MTPSMKGSMEKIQPTSVALVLNSTIKSGMKMVRARKQPLVKASARKQ